MKQGLREGRGVCLWAEESMRELKVLDFLEITVEGKRMLLQVSLGKVKAVNLYLAVGMSSILGISEDSDYT